MASLIGEAFVTVMWPVKWALEWRLAPPKEVYGLNVTGPELYQNRGSERMQTALYITGLTTVFFAAPALTTFASQYFHGQPTVGIIAGCITLCIGLSLGTTLIGISREVGRTR